MLLLVACGGGTQSIVPPAKHQVLAAATLTIHWPGRQAQTSRRRPQWISPSTASIAVEVNDDPSLTTIVDNPSTGQPTTSTITIQAPAGQDSITFSLWDAAGAKGNELGQTTMTQNIVAGQANTVNATIDGIVSRVVMEPLPNQPSVSASTDQTGTTTYTLYGDLPIRFAATPEDADGNVVVDPTNSIRFSLTSSGSELTTAPVTGQGNEFTAAAAAVPSAGHTVGMVLQAADDLGNIAQANYPVVLSPAVYVAYQNSGSGSVAAFDGNGARIALAGSFAGVTKPVSLSYDGQDHRIYVLDGDSSSVLAFNTDGTAVAGFTPPAVPGATSVLYDPNNGCFYVSTSANAIAVFKSDGTPASVPGTFPNLAGPVQLALVDNDPQFWIFAANAAANTVSFYNEDGTVARFGIVQFAYFSMGNLVPSGLAADGQGDLVVAGVDSGTPEMAIYAMTGPFVLGTQAAGVSGPANMFYSPDNNAFMLANATSGTVTVYDLNFGDSGEALTLGATITPPGGLSTPVAITEVP